MSVKKVILPDIGEIHLYKRRGAKSIKLSLTHDGIVRVSLPKWVPFNTGLDFARNHTNWILSKQVESPILNTGNRVGKAHRLEIIQSNVSTKIISKIVGSELRLYIPADIDYRSPEVQLAAQKLAKRSLKIEANTLLGSRLNDLTRVHGLTYRSFGVRLLKSRWGSCSSQGDITLNYFLIQLPWHLIDYVILHELTHTKVLAHSKEFWSELEKLLPNTSKYRQEIKAYKPILATDIDS